VHGCSALVDSPAFGDLEVAMDEPSVAIAMTPTVVEPATPFAAKESPASAGAGHPLVAIALGRPSAV
jgi:hypothetical protein